MKIETRLITKLLLTDLDRLDAVSVIVENTGPCAGSIIIECYGSVWTYYWSSMGDRTVEEFFQAVDVGYLVRKLEPRDTGIAYITRIVEAVRQAFKEIGE